MGLRIGQLNSHNGLIVPFLTSYVHRPSQLVLVAMSINIITHPWPGRASTLKQRDSCEPYAYTSNRLILARLPFD